MNIGTVAEGSGVAPKTIRYYESIGLIHPAVRGPNGYRTYAAIDTRTLKFVKRARSLGFPVEEVRDLLDLWRDKTRASAGVTLIKGDLAGIVRARHLSRAVMRNIRQNLFLAFVYNSFGVPVAAGVLYPIFGLLLSPIIAAAAMSLSSFSVVGNALRLRAARI